MLKSAESYREYGNELPGMKYFPTLQILQGKLNAACR